LGYVLILIVKLPQRIAKLCGKRIFEAESDESMNDIKKIGVMDIHIYYFIKVNDNI